MRQDTNLLAYPAAVEGQEFWVLCDWFVIVRFCSHTFAATVARSLGEELCGTCFVVLPGQALRSGDLSDELPAIPSPMVAELLDVRQGIHVRPEDLDPVSGRPLLARVTVVTPPPKHVDVVAEY